MAVKEEITEVFRIELTPAEIARYKRINAAADNDDESADPWGYVEQLCRSRGKQCPGCAAEELDKNMLVISELTYITKGTGEKISLS